MPNRVVHFEIEAQDNERAKKFYTDAFGWEMDQTGADYGNYVVIKTGDPKEPAAINGGMYVGPQQKVINAYSCVIAVDDIDDAIEKVKVAGGTIIGDKADIPGVGIYVKCMDTEENHFSLMEPRVGPMLGEDSSSDSKKEETSSEEPTQ